MDFNLDLTLEPFKPCGGRKLGPEDLERNGRGAAEILGAEREARLPVVNLSPNRVAPRQRRAQPRFQVHPPHSDGCGCPNMRNTPS